MLGSGWRTGEGESRGGDLCAGSGVRFVGMEKLKASANVWGADEAFLSPPEYGSSLATSLEDEESSEDCEDYISELAEEIAQSMLKEDEEASMKSVPWGTGVLKPAWSGHQMASSPTSPQSTLAGMGCYNWEVRSSDGNVGSSGVSSPPTPQEGDATDVLYAEVLRIKLEDQVKLANQQQMLSRQQQIIQRPTVLSSIPNVLPSGGHLPLDAMGPSKSSKYARNRGGQELENYHFRGGSKQQVGGVWACGPFGSGGGKGIINNKARREENEQFSLFASNMEGNSVSVSNRATTGGVASSSRKQEERGGMRAVFLGSTASRECGGTGVFLPRRPQDSKRKPACATVLLPSRIVHALNLKIEDTLPSPNRRDLSSNSQWRRNPQVGSRRSKPKDEIPSCYFPTSHPMTLQEVAPDISLPSEWTY